MIIITYSRKASRDNHTSHLHHSLRIPILSPIPYTILEIHTEYLQQLWQLLCEKTSPKNGPVPVNIAQYTHSPALFNHASRSQLCTRV